MATLEFWFEFASPYSYVAAMRIGELCAKSGVDLAWKPFSLGPIFRMQGWETSHFNLNPLRGKYMWRDMQRLTTKFGLPWHQPTEFPRNTILPLRVAAGNADEKWIGDYVRAIYVASFSEDADISQPEVVAEALTSVGADSTAVMVEATDGARRSALRANTERAIELGIFGAPNCLVNGELFWGEESLEDAIAWLGPSVGRQPPELRR